MMSTNKGLVLSVPKVIAFNNTNITIEKNVLELFSKYEQHSKLNNEACGILMCSIDKDLKNVYINHATSPQPKDIRKYMYFFLKDKNHQKELNMIFEKSKGTVFLCGTWHTHAEDVPIASKLDIEEWEKFIKGNAGTIEHFYFVIAGRKEISIYTYLDKKIVLIS